MGDWPTVQAVPMAERLAFYYVVAQSNGYMVDWETGSVARRQ
jgi:hypothetical protein